MALYHKLVLFFLLFYSTLHATTIVLIRNQDGVYIGADSRIGDENGNDLGSECKVMKVGDYYFTHAGLGIDAKYGFNIKEIARDVFASNLSFEEKIAAFTATVEDACTAYLDRIKFGRRDVYQRVVNGDINIETAIAGVDDAGTPFFQVIKFTAAGSDENIKISMPVQYTCPGDCDGGKVVVMLGQMSHSQGAVDDWAYGMMRRPVRAINYLINKEIENNDRVGPPVTILKIDRYGPEWIQSAVGCND